MTLIPGFFRRFPPLQLTILSVIVGAVTGLGAIAFKMLLALLHNIFFQAEFSFVYDANKFMDEAVWGAGIILVPAVGGMLVVWLVRNFAPEARGHGVPEVMDAIYFNQGIIRPSVALVKSLASALSIGSGAAVGREGPIIQIGSALGSSIAQFLNMPSSQRITLLACGAGAGIAATFNTPLGAVLFALELMMPEITAATFLPVVLATGMATYVGRLVIGLHPAFIVPIASLPQEAPTSLPAMGGALVLGAVCGVAAWAFIRLLGYLEDNVQRLIPNEYLLHATGMLLVGLIMYGLFHWYGHYYVAGVGYGTIQAILQGLMTSLPLLAALAVAKLIATSLTLGSGASGGIFSPSLFIGATLGGAFGSLGAAVLPGMGIKVVPFAMMGMAGVVGATTGASLTAIVMIFEMTRDYNIIVPMILCVAAAAGIRRLLYTETIYTIKLLARGHHIPTARHGNMFMVQPARTVMSNGVTCVDGTGSIADVLDELESGRVPERVLAVDGHRIMGVLPSVADMLEARSLDPDMPANTLACQRFVLAHPDDIMFDVLKRMVRHDVDTALVVGYRHWVPRVDDVHGLITRRQIGHSVLAGMENYAD